MKLRRHLSISAVIISRNMVKKEVKIIIPIYKKYLRTIWRKATRLLLEHPHISFRKSIRPATYEQEAITFADTLHKNGRKGKPQSFLLSWRVVPSPRTSGFSCWPSNFHSHLFIGQGPRQAVYQWLKMSLKTCPGQTKFESYVSGRQAGVHVYFKPCERNFSYCHSNIFKCSNQVKCQHLCFSHTHICQGLSCHVDML